MYKKFKLENNQTEYWVLKVDTNTSVPFDPANTDYQQFKSDVLAGAELQDADGVPMSQEAADSFIKELP